MRTYFLNVYLFTQENNKYACTIVVNGKFLNVKSLVDNFLQTKEYLDKAVGVLRQENQVLTNHPNAQIYK